MERGPRSVQRFSCLLICTLSLTGWPDGAPRALAAVRNAVASHASLPGVIPGAPVPSLSLDLAGPFVALPVGALRFHAAPSIAIAVAPRAFPMDLREFPGAAGSVLERVSREAMQAPVGIAGYYTGERPYSGEAAGPVLADSTDGGGIPVRGIPRPGFLMLPKVLRRQLRRNEMETWLYWEETRNSSRHRQGVRPVALEVVAVQRNAVRVDAVKDLSPQIKGMFIKGDVVMWPRHPFNRNRGPLIPFQRRRSAEIWSARLTASRSLIVSNGNSEALEYLFSIKLPTDHVISRGPREADRFDLREEAIDARRMSDYLDKIQGRYGREIRWIFLREVLAVIDRKTKNAFVVRDIEPLTSGGYYMPGFSIPILGPLIAAQHGMGFEQFWAEYFAVPLGRFNAYMWVRYGIALGSLHSQNFRIELDHLLRPTGRFVFHDTGDWAVISPLIQAAGLEALVKDAERTDKLFFPSLMQLTHFPGPRDENLIGQQTREMWETTFLKACLDELQMLLESRIELDEEHKYGYRGAVIAGMRRFLTSRKGLRAIRRYHAGLKRVDGTPGASRP